MAVWQSPNFQVWFFTHETANLEGGHPWSIYVLYLLYIHLSSSCVKERANKEHVLYTG